MRRCVGGMCGRAGRLQGGRPTEVCVSRTPGPVVSRQALIEGIACVARGVSLAGLIQGESRSTASNSVVAVPERELHRCVPDTFAQGA